MGEDLRVLKTKHNIESQFLRLLEAHDFKEITIRQIIDGCRINRSTFYRNYEDKYDLAEKIVGELVERFCRTLNTEFICRKANGEKSHVSLFMPMLDYFEENRRVLMLLHRKPLPVNIFDRMLSVYSESLLREIVRQYRVPKKKLKIAAYFAQVIAGNILTAMKWWHLENPEISKDGMLEIMIHTVDKGILSSLDLQFL